MILITSWINNKIKQSNQISNQIHRIKQQLNIVLLLAQTMWQVYPYNHGKLKLAKDLKTGEAHLRISLIQQDQIENMGRIYNDRKKYYKIDEQALTAPVFKQEEIEEQTTGHLSYKEKVDLYRRRLQNQKLQDKYNILFKKTEKRKYKMRRPILYKLLQNFQDGHRHEENTHVREDLKESQKNLEMIRINTNRRVKFKKNETNHSVLDRPRFLSLENGLPQKQIHVLPNWIDFLEGKYNKPDKATNYLNLTEFQTKIDNEIQKSILKCLRSNNPYPKENNYFILHRETSTPGKDRFAATSKTSSVPPQNIPRTLSQNAPKSERQHIFSCNKCTPQQVKAINQGNQQQEDQNKNKSQNKFYLTNNSSIERKKLYSKQATRTKPNILQQNVTKVAERTFTKSENYSKQVIETMSSFYQCKNHKRQDYKKMVFHLKNDRPLTSDIRRKNYKVIGQENIQQVKDYRVQSQHQRLKLKNQNYQFYLEILHQLTSHNVEELYLSGKIMDRLRSIFESNYIITKKHFQFIAQPSLYQQRDVKSEYILQKIQQFIKKFKHI